MTNGKPDETTREMTENEIAFAKIDEAERLSKKRVNGKLVAVDPNAVVLKSTFIIDITQFSLTNKRHFHSRRRRSAYRFASANGGVVAHHEMLVV